MSFAVEATAVPVRFEVPGTARSDTVINNKHIRYLNSYCKITSLTVNSSLRIVTLRAPGNSKFRFWRMLTKQLTKTSLSQWVRHCRWNWDHSSRSHFGVFCGHLPHTLSWVMFEYAKVCPWWKAWILRNSSIESPFNISNIHSCIKLLSVFIHLWHLWFHFLNIYAINDLDKVITYKHTTLIILFEHFLDKYCHIPASNHH